MFCWLLGDERKQITVLPCGNAAGELLDPVILYDGKCFLEEWFNGTEDKVYIGVNESGTMDTATFYTYIKTVVFPYVEQKEGKVIKKSRCIWLPELLVIGYPVS